MRIILIYFILSTFSTCINLHNPFYSMSEQEVEEQVEGSEETLDDDTGETTESPDKASKNKSNFKKLSEALKAERAEKARLAQEKAEMEEELNAWRSENPDLVEKTLSKKESKWTDKSELALFIATNPEAREHLDAIKEFAEDFWIKLDTEEALAKAWKRVKPTIPQESQSEKDFDIKSKWLAKKVDLKSVTMEEIYSDDYTPQQRKEWRKIHYPE